MKISHWEIPPAPGLGDVVLTQLVVEMTPVLSDGLDIIPSPPSALPLEQPLLCQQDALIEELR